MESNQTKFSYEKPFFEDPMTLPDDKLDDDATDAPKGILGWMRTHLVLSLVAAALLVLMILFSLALILMPAEDGSPGGMSLFQTDSSPVPVSPLEQKVMDVKTELDEADPIKGQEPFPPVDLDIRLDKAQR